MRRPAWLLLGLCACQDPGDVAGPHSQQLAAEHAAGTSDDEADAAAFADWPGQARDPGPWCGPAPDPSARLAGREARLRVYLGRGVSGREARAALSSLPAYYQRYGVRFGLAAPPARLDAGALIGAGEPRAALAPLRRLLQQLGEPAAVGPFTLHVVVLRRIASADSPARRYFEELSGLSLGEHLRERDDPLADALALSGPIPPVMLLGLDDLARQRPGTVDLTAAHEFGHLLGLSHQRGADLMNPAPQTCAPPLLPAQQAALAVLQGGKVE